MLHGCLVQLIMNESRFIKPAISNLEFSTFPSNSITTQLDLPSFFLSYKIVCLGGVENIMNYVFFSSNFMFTFIKKLFNRAPHRFLISNSICTIQFSLMEYSSSCILILCRHIAVQHIYNIYPNKYYALNSKKIFLLDF